MQNRRTILKGLALGTGNALLGAVMSQLRAADDGGKSGRPQRFVFVVRANGLRPWGIVPQDLEEYGAARHVQKTFVEQPLSGGSLGAAALPDRP